MSRRSRPGAAVSLLLVVALTSCSSTEVGPQGEEGGSVVVSQDLEARTFMVNVFLTDEGFDPSIVFVPAGRQIRLTLRNRGTTEHHYRIVGLAPTDLRWRMEAEIDDYDLESSPEFADTYVDDVEHVLHHLAPSYVPFRAESPNGVRPIGNEVHGYAASGKIDVVTFYALETGSYTAVDALHPEIEGTLIVFDPTVGA